MQAPFWSESELFSSDCEIIRGRITKKGVKISQKPTFAGGAHRRASFLFPFSVASGHTVHSGARILCFPFPVSPEGYRLWQDAFFVSAHPAFRSPGTRLFVYAAPERFVRGGVLFFPSLHTRRFARPERTKNPRISRGFFQKSMRFFSAFGRRCFAPRSRGDILLHLCGVGAAERRHPCFPRRTREVRVRQQRPAGFCRARKTGFPVTSAEGG